MSENTENYVSTTEMIGVTTEQASEILHDSIEFMRTLINAKDDDYLGKTYNMISTKYSEAERDFAIFNLGQITEMMSFIDSPERYIGATAAFAALLLK